MAWTRVTLLPVGAFSSRTWLGRDDQGREALLREVPEGAMPSGSGVTPAGVVPLRDVVVIDGRRYGVWDLLKAESLQEVVERVLDTGGTVPLGFLCRVVIDAARSLVAMTPMRPHGGLSDASLLITRDGRVQVMDFGCPRPGRFTPSGAPSFVNDVFSMGAVLHASLTGFGGTYADALTEGLQLPTPSQLHDECTPAVDDVVLRAISRAVDKRQPDLELFADELEAVLGEQLFTEAQVGQFLSGAAPARPGPPVPDVDPGPAPGIDDGPTGQHPMLGNKETFTDLPPIAPQVPLGTQPGAPADAFAAVAAPDDAVRYAGIPMSTQPGVPGPAMLQSSPSRPPLAVPLDTQPGLKLPAEPAPVPVETQPRLQLPTSSPSGAVPKSPPVLHASGATPDALARAVPKSPPVLRTSEPAPLDAAAGAIPKPQPAPRAARA
ncbi:MAG: hypothetical protein IAE78_00085, partial [Myxococcus sp.]|nr:hypothetical protein [Myxococcus sp.]